MPRSEASGAPRVVLHVGAPKSGTTYLQRAMRFHSEGLRAAGIHVPDGGGPVVFHAAIEVRDAFDAWGKDRAELTGTWARICREAREFPGTTVMSHEMLAAASRDQAEAAHAELEGCEVHLVLTARDLARQVTSEWQERVKNGATLSFRNFERRVRRFLERSDWSSLFWRQQHLVDIVDRWAVGLPPDRVHVVVSPPPGAEPGLLWRRFGEVVGFDPTAFDPDVAAEGGNSTLGTAQVAVLRRLNAALDGMPPGKYRPVVKRDFAQRVLAQQEGARPLCPPALLDLLTQVAEEQNREIAARGYRVHGELSELIPAPSGETAVSPDDVTVDEEVGVAVAALAEMLTEQAEAAEREHSDGRRLRARVRRRLRRALPLRSAP